MISYGANLGLMVNAATGEVHDVALRGFLRGVDGLVQPNVKGYSINTPPGSPSDGDVYIIGAAPTGAWAAKDNQIARWSSVANAWEFYVPKAGWRVVDSSATGQPQYTFTGSDWTTLITTAGGVNFGQTDLKNYQEGTWTPTIYGRTTAGTPTYVARSGKYTRVGNLVMLAFDLQISAKGGMGGGLALGGLPFAMTGDNAGGGGHINYQSGNAAGIASLLRFNSSTAFYLVSNTAGGVTTDLNDANIAAATRLVGSAMFFI
jgi:hypothetical protein